MAFEKLIRGVMGCAVAANLAYGANWYVSNAGSDDNEGTAGTAPLANIHKAAEKAGNGDIVLLKRGDVFRDSAKFSRDVEIKPYGNSNSPKPVIAGSLPVTGWTRHGGNIYVADFASPGGAPAGYLYVNDKLARLARYPNTGWIRTKTWTENDDGTNTVITTESLRFHPRSGANDYWNGANIRWHRHSWWFETRIITDYASSGQLSLDKKSIIPVVPFNKDGWGFYLDNKLEELDTAGEWYYDESAEKIYLWAPNDANPNDLLVEIGVLPYGIQAGSVTIRDIAFQHQRDKGLQVGRTSTVENCLFEYIGCDSGGAALRGVWNAHNSVITGCVFRNNHNLAISWNENPGIQSNTRIEYDTLINTGVVGGYGGSGVWHAAGIIISNGSGMSIRRNYIDGAGYAGILLGSENDTAEYNIINNAMATLNDGGAIYTNCDSSIIRHNIITNTRGGMESSGPWANLAHGIWPEFLEDFKHSLIENNTCANSGGFGIFHPNNFENVVRGNVLYNNGRAQLQLGGKETNTRTGRTENLPQNNLIENNVLFSAARDQGALHFRQQYDYGILRNNYYCNPHGDSILIKMGVGNRKWTRYWITVAQWQDSFSWDDETPNLDIIKRAADADESDLRGTSKLLINDSPDGKAISVGDNGIYITVRGDTVVGSLRLSPFTSEALVHIGDFSESTMLNAAKHRNEHGVKVYVTRNGRMTVDWQNANRGAATISLHTLDGRRLWQRRVRQSDRFRSENGPLPRIAASGVFICSIREESAYGIAVRSIKLTAR